jgi:hypothetical protein
LREYPEGMSRQPAQPDDDALSWAGDDDPTLDVGERRVDDVASPEVAPARSETAHARADADVDTTVVAGTGSATGTVTSSPAEAPREQMSSVALIAVSVLGGIFLLYTIGWFVSVQRIGTGASDGLRTLMFTVGQVLAVAAAPQWFAASFFATRGRQSRWFVLALIVGAFVLIPWPFVIGAR